MIKAISKEFKGKVIFGEARSTDTDLVAKFGVKHYPTLLEVNPLSSQKYLQQFTRNELEKWIFNLLDNHQVIVFSRELNRSLFVAGNCNSLDSKFCVLVFDPDDEIKTVLNQLSIDFKNDPVEIFWVNSNKYSGFAEAFGSSDVIYRGKKQKYMSINCRKDYGCYNENLTKALSGGGLFTKIKISPDLNEKKVDL